MILIPLRRSNAPRRASRLRALLRVPIPRLHGTSAVELAILEGEMLDTTEKSLLLLAVGVVVIFVVLITPGNQLLLAFGGGVITGTTIVNLIENWRASRR